MSQEPPPPTSEDLSPDPVPPAHAVRGFRCVGRGHSPRNPGPAAALRGRAVRSFHLSSLHVEFYCHGDSLLLPGREGEQRRLRLYTHLQLPCPGRPGACAVPTCLQLLARTRILRSTNCVPRGFCAYADSARTRIVCPPKLCAHADCVPTRIVRCAHPNCARIRIVRSADFARTRILRCLLGGAVAAIPAQLPGCLRDGEEAVAVEHADSF